jgi:hypothetical protein
MQLYRNRFWIGLISLISCHCYGQQFGENAFLVKEKIEKKVWDWEDKRAKGTYPFSPGSLESKNHKTISIEHRNEEIAEVIECDSFSTLFVNLLSSHCTHYVMKEGKLSYWSYRFDPRVSLEELRVYFEKEYGRFKSGDNYFVSDKLYYRIFEDKNKTAVVEFRNDKIAPETILKQMKLDESEKEEITMKIERDIEAQEKRKQQITSKVYDISKYPDEYNRVLKRLQEIILELMTERSQNNLGWNIIAGYPDQIFMSRNTYSIKLKLQDNHYNSYAKIEQVSGRGSVSKSFRRRGPRIWQYGSIEIY